MIRRHGESTGAQVRGRFQSVSAVLPEEIATRQVLLEQLLFGGGKCNLLARRLVRLHLLLLGDKLHSLRLLQIVLAKIRGGGGRSSGDIAVTAAATYDVGEDRIRERWRQACLDFPETDD